MLSNNKTGAHALSRGDDRKSCAPQLDDGAETQHVYISRLVVPFIEDMGDAYGPDLAGLRAPSPSVSAFGAIPIAGDPLDQRGGDLANRDALAAPGCVSLLHSSGVTDA